MNNKDKEKYIIYKEENDSKNNYMDDKDDYNEGKIYKLKIKIIKLLFSCVFIIKQILILKYNNILIIVYFLLIDISLFDSYIIFCILLLFLNTIE